MKICILAGVLVAGVAASGVACTVPANAVDPAAVLNNNTACYPPTAPFQNQELHNGTTMVDYKKGPSDPRDPSVTVGSYSVASNIITYTYGTTTFSYYLVPASGSGTLPGLYNFFPGATGTGAVCTATLPSQVNVKAGGGAC